MSAPHHNRVRFLAENLDVSVRPGEVILTALQRHGYTHSIGCRRGGCGRCKIKLLEGSVHDEATVATTVLSEAERNDGWCLSCRAVPVSDLTVRLHPDDRLIAMFPWATPAIPKESAP